MSVSSMNAISAVAVDVLLDYICPLSGPLPPHLVSPPLLQRHHFLAISSDNPVEYLAWPSAQQSHAVGLLQTEPIQSHRSPFVVHYAPDPENFAAHVRITTDLRLVFLWSPHNAWQYHNVALMPFPPHSYSDFAAAVASLSPNDFLQEQNYSATITAGDDDDDYWNDYGHGDDDPHQPPISVKLDVDPEDAYWAQYSKVQGSGDSTLPSPRPEKQRLESEPGRIFVPSDDLQVHHTEPYNPLEPPSPDALARRLAVFASASGANSPSLIDDAPTTDSDNDSPPAEVAQLSASASNHPTDGLIVVDTAVGDPGQDALKDHIRSLYHLWKQGRQHRSDDEDKPLFLAAVHRVLDEFK